MNRQQRRQAQKQKYKPVTRPQPYIPMTASDVEKIKQDAIDSAMVLLFGIPVKVLRDYYGWGAKKRLPEFADYLTDVYADFSNGDMTLEDFEQLVWEECGLKFLRDGENNE